jgi:hypothetical protein
VGTIVTDDMLQNLPAPVQRYLQYTGVVETPIPSTVRLRQAGRIRQDEKSAWMRLKAEEYYATDPPGFVWKAVFPRAGLPVVLGRDTYAEGKGSILMKLCSLLPIADAAGEKVGQGAMMRYLNEMVWFPAAFLGENITWKALDDLSAEVTLTDRGKSVTATVSFDENGKPTSFAARRYHTASDSYQMWSTPFTEHGEFAGLKLPIRGRGVWHLPEGELVYIELEVTELEYNATGLY